MAGSIDTNTVIINQAAQRGGVCDRQQLLSAGLSAGAIDHRVRSGFLQSIGRGVYLLPGLWNPSTPFHRASALVDPGILSHVSGGHILRFSLEARRDDDPVHIITRHGVSRQVEGVRIHPRRRLPCEHDIVVVDGLRVTSPARTIVDLASTIGPARLRHIVQTQVLRDRPTLPELVGCLESTARQGVNGVTQLRRLLVDLFDDRPISQSALEAATVDLLAANRIAGFQPQYRPPWYDGWRGVVDFANVERQLILEADGRRWHQRDQEMTDDRRRDRLSAAHGWLTIRVTWTEVVERPAATAIEISEIVATRAKDRAA